MTLLSDMQKQQLGHNYFKNNNFEKYEKYVSNMREEYDKINLKDEMVN